MAGAKGQGLSWTFLDVCLGFSTLPMLPGDPRGSPGILVALADLGWNGWRNGGVAVAGRRGLSRRGGTLCGQERRRTGTFMPPQSNSRVGLKRMVTCDEGLLR